jgi:hypothetical protein
MASRVTSAAAAALLSACTVLASTLSPAPAHAKAIMTPDEKVSIGVYKRSTPSVVSIANMSTR